MQVNTKQQQNQEQPKQTAQGSLREMILKSVDMFKMALPKHITPDRMVRIAMTAVTKNPLLAKCTLESFFGSLLTAAQLGLEVNTPLGEAYLIPYYNTKKQVYECQFQLGYQGALSLAYRSGQFRRIKAVVVHEGDDFAYCYGINPELKHIQNGDEEKTPTHVYALYELKNGGYDFEVWDWKRVEAHAKKYSKSYNDSRSSWQTAPEEMAKKTVLTKLLKYAPRSIELFGAIQKDGGIIQNEILQDGTAFELIENIRFNDDFLTSNEAAAALPEPHTPQAAELQNTPHAQPESESVENTSKKPASPPPKPKQQQTEPQLNITAEDEAALDALFENQQDAGMLGFSM
ncbi:MAG: recombinase RecT [Treponema sp.]